MTATDFKNHPEVYEAVTEICTLNDVAPSTVARCIGMQPGTYKRTMCRNPTVGTLKRTAWALGLDWHFLAMSPQAIRAHGAALVRCSPDAPVFYTKSIEDARPNNRRNQIMRKHGVDPTDKELLAQQYPPAAIAAKEVLDSRFQTYDDPVPPKAVNPAMWKQSRQTLSDGLPGHLVMTDKAVEAGYSYKQYMERKWTLEQLAQQGLICEKGQEG